jgi:hypothetical protein
VSGSTAEDNAAIAAEIMGDYYPVGTTCSKQQFEAGGPLSCFAAGG